MGTIKTKLDEIEYVDERRTREATCNWFDALDDRGFTGEDITAGKVAEGSINRKPEENI